MPQLSYTTFDGVVHTHQLKQGTTRIGRTPDNDLQIDELAVSAQHCEIRYTGDAMMVKDLDSVAGTYVEGEPVTEREIKPGQVRLGLGAFLVQVQDSASPAAGGPSGSLDFTPVRLADGSYSCLRHPARRAVFECGECFNLACADCVRHVELRGGSKETFCGLCGARCRPIDWSGLAMGKKEALISLLPEPVQRALDFRAKRRGN